MKYKYISPVGIFAKNGALAHLIQNTSNGLYGVGWKADSFGLHICNKKVFTTGKTEGEGIECGVLNLFSDKANVQNLLTDALINGTAYSYDYIPFAEFQQDTLPKNVSWTSTTRADFEPKPASQVQTNNTPQSLIGNFGLLNNNNNPSPTDSTAPPASSSNKTVLWIVLAVALVGIVIAVVVASGNKSPKARNTTRVIYRR